jgi:hypothetical protein
MDGPVDWLVLAITVPIVPMLGIIGAVIWLRVGRARTEDAVDDPPPVVVGAQPDGTGADERPMV